MLVRKKNPDWRPSENKELKVGETIEITDPRQLILNGDVTAIDETGVERSAYELYGVLVKDELNEFQEFLKVKKAEAEKSVLEAEKAKLEAELAAATPAPVAAEPAKPEIKATEDAPLYVKPEKKK